MREYKTDLATRIQTRERVRRHRRNNEIKGRLKDVEQSIFTSGVDVDLLGLWSEEKLKIPFGHPLQGQGLRLPDYGLAFLRDAIEVPESLFSVARKNAKSAIIAVYCLGRLVGPIKESGYRAGVCSVTREKASELWMQMQAIAEASGFIGIGGLKFMKAPRSVESSTGRVDILSADGNAGHASGFDDAIVDELGLLKERDRELVNGLRSSVSAKNGRFIALSIQGSAPFTAEMLDRRHEPGIVVHHYSAPDDCLLDDERAWAEANPGLESGIKSIEYMRHQARRCLVTPADAPAFRAYDLNQPQDPAAQMLIEFRDWMNCVVEELPAAIGPMVLGIDLGSGYAMSAAVAYWPQTGRLEGFAAFPSQPGLLDRGRADGVGSLYVQMASRGELKLCGEGTVEVGEFMHVALNELGQPDVVVCDTWRKRELIDALVAARGSPGAIVTRRMGWKDGAEDVRAFQRAVMEGRVKTLASRLAESAMSGARTISDPAGNHKLAKKTEGGRRSKHKDDWAAAAVIAVSYGYRFWKESEIVSAPAMVTV